MKAYKPGPLTKTDAARVEKYQSASGLQADGKPGHQTVNHALDEIATLKGDLHECRSRAMPNISGIFLVGGVIGFALAVILFVGPM